MPYISGHDPNLGKSSEANIQHKALSVSSNQYTSSASITRPNDTNAYADLDVLSNSTTEPTVITFANVGPSGGNIIINSVFMRCDVNVLPSGMSTFRLHLYNAAPTAINDNAAYNLPSADRSKYLGWVDIPKPTDIGDTLWSQTNGLSMQIKLATGSTALYGILQTMTAYTPSASIVKTITINSVGV